MELSDYAKQIKSQLTPTEWKIAIAIAEESRKKCIIQLIFSKLEIEKTTELKTE